MVPTSLILSSDVDQDTQMFGLHEIPLTYPENFAENKTLAK